MTDQNNEVQSKKSKKDVIRFSGRRKTAVARIFMTEGKGDILINKMEISKYFPSEREKLAIYLPFHLVGISHPSSKYDISVLVKGSGKAAQLEAIVHGISKILAGFSDENHSILRRNGYLTRDPRMVERKKPFLKKARKRPQYSKR